MTQLHINTLASSALKKCLGRTTGHGNANSLHYQFVVKRLTMNTQDQDNQEVSARGTTMMNHAKRCKSEDVDAKWIVCFILARGE